jgi:hypothetical protein
MNRTLGRRALYGALVFLAAIVAALAAAIDWEEKALPVLRLDGRYCTSIEFHTLGVTVPIGVARKYLRSDGLVNDLGLHQDELLRELSVRPNRIGYTNPASCGRTMVLGFAGNLQCAFVWAKCDRDSRIAAARLEHEKLHALIGLNRRALPILERAIEEKWGTMGLSERDEELAATIIEVLSMRLQGVELETIGGSQLVVEARELLKAARSRKRGGSERPL